MKFGSVPLDAAIGHINAHSVIVGLDKIAKGHVLTANDIQLMKDDGLQEVVVAQLEPGDLHEDDAARTLANALTKDVPNLRLSVAATGRVNIYAEAEGLVTFDPDAIQKMNDINPMITIAIVAPFHRLRANGMVATIKIISYAVPDTDIQAACHIDPNLGLATGQYSSATMIETRFGETVPADKGRRALIGRIGPLGCQLSPRSLTHHAEEPLAQAILDAPGEVIFILTDSATSDAYDVAPAALRLAGGTVHRFGMPVDPGNLLFIGDLHGKPVIGLPGCARSPALNGADFVLNRVLCGIPVTGADIAGMGVGGLLKEIPTRPRPRAS